MLNENAKKLPVFLVLTLLASCASPPPPVVVQEAPKPASPKPAPKVDTREPGSLWSEDSSWNAIYSVASTRLIGESLSIRLGKAMRKRILAEDPAVQNAAKTPPGAPADASAGTVAKDGQPSAPREPAQAAQANAGKGSSPAETGAVAARADEGSAELHAVITEVLPNQVLRIAGIQSIKLGGKTVDVSYDGMVRERDISEDNAIPSDALFNLKLSADFPEGKPVVPKTETKPKKKSPPPPPKQVAARGGN